jgi:hypothetical protein
MGKSVTSKVSVPKDTPVEQGTSGIKSVGDQGDQGEKVAKSAVNTAKGHCRLSYIWNRSVEIKRQKREREVRRSSQRQEQINQN